MSLSLSIRSVLLTAVVALVATVSPTRGDDHFLVIGGGYAPTGNQISLEKNVLLFQTMLDEFYPSGAARDVFFSDGDDPGRDLQYRTPVEDLPRANLLLARVMRQTDDLAETYRSHEIPGVDGPTSRESLDAWFRHTGQTLDEGDRLVIYVTAHGGRAPKDDPRNTVLYLWDRKELHVKDLASLLDTLPEGVRVVLVMVQCYSGGFAELAFQGGDRDNGFARTDRCGFFATTHDRPAAGCTPDIDEENYHEYSSYFWEAIRGQTRTGDPIDRDPDLDGDGAVSFAEAHAYALLESVTVDISVKTSDAFLRHYSRTEENGARGLLTADSSYGRLLAVASVPDRAVMEGLSDELGLSGPNRAAQARRAAEAAQDAKKQLDGRRRGLQRQFNRLADRIKNALIARWPELKNPWNPRVTTLLTTEADAVVDAIESHPDYESFDRLRSQLADLSAQRLDQDRVWVKCQRLLRTLEAVALAANLPQVAPSDVVDRYHRLLAAESGTLRSAPPAAALAPAER